MTYVHTYIQPYIHYITHIQHVHTSIPNITYIHAEHAYLHNEQTLLTDNVHIMHTYITCTHITNSKHNIHTQHNITYIYT